MYVPAAQHVLFLSRSSQGRTSPKTQRKSCATVVSCSIINAINTLLARSRTKKVEQNAPHIQNNRLSIVKSSGRRDGPHLIFAVPCHYRRFQPTVTLGQYAPPVIAGPCRQQASSCTLRASCDCAPAGCQCTAAGRSSQEIWPDR